MAYVPNTGYMKPPYPWLTEEKTEDGTRLVRRCAELAGGCGASVEVPAARISRGDVFFPGFTDWYRKHIKCSVAKGDPRVAAYCERTGDTPEHVRDLVAKGVITL